MTWPSNASTVIVNLKKVMSDQLKSIPLLTVLINRFVNGLLTRCCFDLKAFDIVKNAALPRFKLEAIVKSYMKRRRKRKNIGERSLETGEELMSLMEL